MIERGSFN